MDLDKYILLLSIYNRIEIGDITEKNRHFNEISESLVKSSNIDTDDIKTFNQLLILLNDRIFSSVKDLLVVDDCTFYAFVLMREVLSVKYNEKICFDIIDKFIGIVEYYNSNTIRNIETILYYIIKEKSNSTDEEIATEGKLKYIKYKRRGLSRHEFTNSTYDDLPF